MTFRNGAILALALTASSTIASAQGDLLARRIGFNSPWHPESEEDDIHSYGVASGIAAYSASVQACNSSDSNLPWTTGIGQNHPVLGQNLFRLKGRRFEQLGQSWLMHGFCSLCEFGCGFRGASGCSNVLRVGCADTLSASLTDGQGGGPKFTVDPTRGDHLHPDPVATGHPTLRGRLQLAVADIDPQRNQDATYFLEGMWVHYQDHQNGYAHNNVTWRKVKFANNDTYRMRSASPDYHSAQAGIHGWKAEDPQVVILELQNTNEGGSGVHGYYQLGYRVWDNGDGTWDYIYVVNNQNSTQGAGEFRVPVGSGVSLTRPWFNDVDYHSGELQDGTDWNMNQSPSEVIWSCPETYAENINANAVNWGTAYSFGFTANSAPTAGVGALQMFEPGVGTSMTFPVDGPGAMPPSVGSSFCFGSGGAACPCGNSAGAGEGCLNSGGSGATLAAMGVASASTGDLFLVATQATALSSGLFFGGTTKPGGGDGVAFGDGLLCAGGSITRLQVVPTNALGSATSSIAIPTKDDSMPGETRHYQYWFRDPVQGPCSNGFNTSSAITIIWGP